VQEIDVNQFYHNNRFEANSNGSEAYKDCPRGLISRFRVRELLACGLVGDVIAYWL